MLDLPHYIYVKMKKCCTKKRKYMETKFEDDWYFDIGYHFAFSITVFTVVFIFSVAAPLIPIFGFLFFTLKVSLTVLLS
jgi:hypothetical protein